MHVLLLASRIFACLVGCIAFYLSFFLYEDEEGELQNRLDKVWIQIDDRAKATDSIWTALFNKSAQIVVKASNVMFGHQLLSFKTLNMSVILSIEGSIFANPLFYPIFHYNSYESFSLRLELFLRTLIMVALGLVLIIRRPNFRPFTVPVGILSAVLCVLSFNRLWAIKIYHPRLSDVLATNFAFFLSLLIAVGSDFLAIAAVRQTFRIISTRSSIFPILKSLVVLALICLAVEPIPVLFLNHFHSPESATSKYAVPLPNAFAGYIFGLNLSTVVYCIVPAVVLSFLLLHKLIWPVLSRVIYPIVSRKLLNNRKAMAALGGLALTYAILGKVAFEKLFGLFT